MINVSGKAFKTVLKDKILADEIANQTNAIKAGKLLVIYNCYQINIEKISYGVTVWNNTVFLITNYQKGKTNLKFLIIKK